MPSQQMKQANRLRRKLEEGQGPSYGAWQALPSVQISRMYASAGYDWVLIDCEHGDIDDRSMRECVRALADNGVSPIVRIPDLHGSLIKRAYDAGAHAILVPLIENVEDVRKVVSWSKYPPMGTRGMGPFMTHQSFGLKGATAAGEYGANANDNLLVFVQIETRGAVEQIEDICKVDGLDGVLVGPYDLGLNLGHPVKAEIPPELAEVIGKVVKTAKTHGKKTGMFTYDGNSAKKAAAQGFDFINAAVDVAILWNGMGTNIAAANTA